MAIELKSSREIATMRRAGRIVAGTLALMQQMAAPGVTTGELDRAAEQFIESKGAVPSFKGYRGFPATICASLNDEIVHGIPGRRQLSEGDLLKVDCGAIVDGYHADSAVTIAVGQVSKEARRLMQVTQAALQAGIAAVHAGARVSDVSRAVQTAAENAGFAVVTEYTGHGIGQALHEDPKVPNYVTRSHWLSDPELQPGCVLAIEPMVNVGTHRTKVQENGWTVVTRDGALSAHYEHTVAVQEHGPVILTLA
jgi:methionyl aminopeptidase